MIENWKQAYRMLSVWVFALAGSLAGLEQFLPALESKIPPAVYACLMILGIVARLIRQPKLQTPEEIWRAAQEAKEAAKKGGLVLLVLLSVGCASNGRPPEFTDAEKLCLAESEAQATLAVASCGENTDGDCSSDAIIDRQQARDERCIK